MRFPVPERLGLKAVAVLAVSLFVLQQLASTDLRFSLLCSLYIFLFRLAFNAGGGLNYFAGAFIFFGGVLGALLGLFYKAFLFEPAQSHLKSPIKTMLCYCVGMAGLWIAARLSTFFRLTPALLSGMSTGTPMNQAAIGCLILGVAVQLYNSLSTISGGSIASAVNQLNHLPQMAMILAVTHMVRSTNGRRSTNWVVWTSVIYQSVLGAFAFSKEGMFAAPVTYMITAVSLGFSFSKKQLLALAILTFVASYYLVPFSQYGRTARLENGTNAAVAIAMLRHPNETRRLFLETEEAANDDGSPHFFDKPAGLFDREQMLAFDDALITYTDEGNVVGLRPTYDAFLNIVPKFLRKDKPNLNPGNQFGREIGVIQDDDTSTGISFGPTGDAYHEAKWTGVAIVFPVVCFMLFFIADSLAGDIRKAPWNLLLIALAEHIAPQGLLNGVIYVMTYSTVAVVLIALLSRTVLPYLVLMFTGRTRMNLQSPQFRPSVRSPRFSSGLSSPPPSNHKTEKPHAE